MKNLYNLYIKCIYKEIDTIYNLKIVLKSINYSNFDVYVFIYDILKRDIFNFDEIKNIIKEYPNIIFLSNYKNKFLTPLEEEYLKKIYNKKNTLIISNNIKITDSYLESFIIPKNLDDILKLNNINNIDVNTNVNHNHNVYYIIFNIINNYVEKLIIKIDDNVNINDNNFNFIKNYDLFLFDLDGTLIDSEKLHYDSYKKSIIHFKIPLNFEYNDYVKLCHSPDNIFKKFIELYNNYDDFHNYKESIFERNINNNLNYINGAEKLLINLLKNNKNICIVTNSSKKRINIVKKILPILNLIENWICKDDCLLPKPNSECYIKSINKFNVTFDKIIVFEDSYKGFKSLDNLNINKVLIQNSNYVYYNDIICNNKYENFNKINYIEEYIYDNKFNNKIFNYTSQINDFSTSIFNVINLILPLLTNCKNNIYICGIGKSNHVCNKCVSTWQSFGINVSSLLPLDLFHGDFGIFKNEDIIIYISNSGNTEELLNISKYIKLNFKILQISITNNPNALIKEYTNINLTLGDKKIVESDSINMAPSASSVLFMITLDLIGIYIAENRNITKEEFKKYHPGGSLGKL